MDQLTTETRLEELLSHWEEIYEQGQNLPAEELCGDRPELAQILQQRIDARLHEHGHLEDSALRTDANVPGGELAGKVEYSTSLVILRLQGVGGMCDVYSSFDTDLKREVALKALKPALCTVPLRRDRFLREAIISGRLDHPGILPIHGQGQTSDARPFYTMRLVRGQSLEETIRDYHSRRVNVVELRVLLRHMISVCRTVHYAHSRRVLHCDLKPANIMVGKFGETFVLDWGEAQVIDLQSLDLDSSLSVMVKSLSANTSTSGGTLLYMPPERVDKQNSALTPSSDVYSLGATLYKVLTNQDAFHASSPAEAIRRIQAGEYQHPRAIIPKLSPALESICLKAMAKRSKDRFVDAGQMADELQAWMDDEPVHCYRESWLEGWGRWMRQNRKLSLLGLVVMLASIVAGSMWTIAASRRDQQRNQDLASTAAAQESGLRAFALFAATQLGRDVDAAWKTLEVAAADPEVQQQLLLPAEEAADSRELQKWLLDLHVKHHDLLKGSSWFVLDANGDQLARYPSSQIAAGQSRNFAYKTYFHGQEREDKVGTPHAPLDEPSLSPVFWSGSDRCRKIAYSVPIWRNGKHTGTPLGVLVMTVRLGDIELLDIDVDDGGDGVKRHALLTDLRPDWEGRTGSLLQHPAFDEKQIEPSQPPCLDQSLVSHLQKKVVEQSGARHGRPSLLPEFRDPILQRSSSGAVALVSSQDRRFGWFVIIEEDAAKPQPGQ